MTIYKFPNRFFFFLARHYYVANKLHVQLLEKSKNYIMLPFTHKQLKYIMILQACRLQNHKKCKKGN